MKTSSVFVGIFILVAGLGWLVVATMLGEKRACDSAIQEHVRQIKRDPYTKPSDLTDACANPTAHVLDRLISR